MKKIILIGPLSDIIRSISDGLMQKFQVQICTDQAEVIQSMMKITRPDLLLYCPGNAEDGSVTFGEALRKNKPTVPVLIICTKEEWTRMEPDCGDGLFYKLIRPVTTSKICNTCEEILGNGKKKKETASSKADGNEEAPKRIMVVDDTPLLLRNMKSMLDGYYEVFVAPSGKDALALIPVKKPDLVLLDYEMSGMSGREVFETMLKDEYMRTIPVIFLTAVTQKDRVVEVLKSNPAGYIVKPAEKDRLLEEIEKVIHYV